MATKTKTATVNTFIPCKKSRTYGAHLNGVRSIIGRNTGTQSFVLCFDDGAEVVMPGNWTIRETEFPNGLYEGQFLAAYWEPDDEGIMRFNLYEVEEQTA